MTEQKRVTIVVPVYNEGDNIPHFTRAVEEAMAGEPYRYEILFIDDGSRAESRRVLREAARREPHVRAIFLSRNYGHQAALTCGLSLCGNPVRMCDKIASQPGIVTRDLPLPWVNR